MFGVKQLYVFVQLEDLEQVGTSTSIFHVHGRMQSLAS